MATTWIYWTVFSAYLVFLAVAGIRAKAKTHTFEDYMVAGRKIGPVLLGISFGVTYFSAVMIVGGAEYSYLWGLSCIWIAIADCFIGVFLAFVMFGKRTMKLSEEFGNFTVPEFLGKRYNSQALQKFTALVTLIFETIYLVSIYMGLSLLLQYAMPNVDTNLAYTIAVCLCGGITIIYLNFGGAHGAIWTDAAESLIMIGGVAAVFFAGMKSVGGLNGLVDGLNDIDPTGGLTSVPPSIAPFGWVGYILVTSFGVWGMPQMVSRYFTTKQKRSLKWGLLVSITWALIVSLLAWWNGAIGRVYYTEGNGTHFQDGIVPAEILPALSDDILPAWGAALFFAAITAASLTTGEKVIMIASGSFSRDFYQPITGASDEKAMKMTQYTNVVVVVVAVLLALQKPDAVLALCMFAWAALASTTLVPYVYGLFWKKGTAKAGIITGALALFLAVFWKAGVRGFGPNFPNFPFLDIGGEQIATWNNFPVTLGQIHEFIVSQVAAVILFPIISLLTQDDVPKDVDHMFDIMTEKVKVTPKAAKSDLEEELVDATEKPKMM